MLKYFRTNNQIRVPQVKVIDESGAQLGVMSISEAISLAKEKDLDLVEVAPNVSPPIAKIMDYGKFMYQKEKEEKKAKAKHKEQEMKTVRVGFKTGLHDLKFKASQVDTFLKSGHNVKVELTLRGREKALAQLGRQKLDQFLSSLTEPYATQQEIRKSPFGWVTVIQKSKK